MHFKIYNNKDHILLEGCKRQDRQAQETLYKRFSPRMFAICRRYVKDSMEAEDVMVTGFTKVFSHLHQFSGEGSFEGWMKRIMINESLSYLRRHKNMYLETDLEVAEKEPVPNLLESQLAAEDLLAMIAELPLGYRMVFNLYAIDGYSHKEIGTQLGINENTSKSQLSRARALLQKQLRNAYDNQSSARLPQ